MCPKIACHMASSINGRLRVGRQVGLHSESAVGAGFILAAGEDGLAARQPAQTCDRASLLLKDSAKVHELIENGPTVGKLLVSLT